MFILSFLRASLQTKRFSHYLSAFFLTSVLPSLAQTGLGSLPDTPNGTIIWDTEEFESQTGKKWTTVTFPTLKGAFYTLQSSTTLEPGSWQNQRGIYSLGDSLQMALFSKGDLTEQAAPATTQSSSESSSESSETLHHFSFQLQPFPADSTHSGLAVRWILSCE